MSMEKFIEDKIVEAMERGEFDNLPGKGKPLDLDEYFKAPEHLRVGYMLLKNAGFVPAEMEMLKEIEALKNELAACVDDGRKKYLERAINEKNIGFNMMIEKRKK